MYGIFHVYDVDGGFGDCIGQKDLLFVVESEEVAKAYCEKWSNPYVYDTPYAYLSCGELVYEELILFDWSSELPSPYDICGARCNPYRRYDEDDWKEVIKRDDA